MATAVSTLYNIVTSEVCNIQLYVAYKRLISLKKINPDLESKGGKKLSKQMDPINRQK
jgi:hypothetical protein